MEQLCTPGDGAGTRAKLPLIFYLHGTHNPIQLTESYGIVQVPVREECVVITPEDENWESMEELLQYDKWHYPVDERPAKVK